MEKEEKKEKNVRFDLSAKAGPKAQFCRKEKLWSYIGMMTPQQDIHVMTRAGQGLLGSDAELTELLTLSPMSHGYCIAIRVM